MELTRHAKTRMQQRGIRPEMLEALLDHGRVARAGGGCDIVYFDKHARAALAAEAERLRNSYAIVGSDGAVITVGHRTRRIPR